MRKKLLVVFTLAILILGMVALAYANAPIKLLFNGEELKTDVAPKLIEGRVLVPIRVIAETLGADVEWNAEQNAVLINNTQTQSLQAQVARLEQALAPQEPLTAVKTWAEGVKMRNAALQYAVMNPELKKEHYAEFAAMNWSTGTSSPWIESYQIMSDTKVDATTYRYEVAFTFTDSTQSKFTNTQYVIVKQYDDKWLLAEIGSVDVRGQITEIFYDSNQQVTGIFVESKSPVNTAYDKAKVMLGPETKIYQGYTNETFLAKDLKEGMTVEAVFNGPVLMIYPVQGGAKEIRVFE